MFGMLSLFHCVSSLSLVTKPEWPALALWDWLSSRYDRQRGTQAWLRCRSGQAQGVFAWARSGPKPHPVAL